MKKLCLFSVLTAMCVNAVYAADIASNATTAQCVEPTLHRYEGTANLQAQWEANTVPLRWYNNYTMINPTDAIDDCEYSGSLTRPENPSRVGYTFKGWTVSPKVEFSTLSLGSVAAISYGKGIYNNKDHCYYYDTEIHASNELCSMTEFTELLQYEWKQPFANGTVYGMAHCSAMPGDSHSSTWPAVNISDYTSTLEAMNTYDTQHSSEEKKYCWCQATGYKASNQTTIQRPLSSLAWVLNRVDTSAPNCAYYCTMICAYSVRGNSNFRTALFAPAN